MMISSIISRVVILVFGTLYPAYASYKAVRTKNLKEYVKWMMYWIVFALFTCAETFTDVFLSWFPFYYEIKIVLVIWLLSPATKGSSILYRKFVHPALARREQEIDDAIAKAKEQGYHTVLNLGSRGVNYATNVIMQTAIKGGGGLVQQLKKSYSLSDLTESLPPIRQDGADEADDVLAPAIIRRSVARSGYNTRRSASESNNRSPIYFSEVDVDIRTTRSSHPMDFSHIKSSEDVSSGYSSADTSKEQALSRAGSLGPAARPRTRLAAKTTVTTIKRAGAAEDDDYIIEELRDIENSDYEKIPPLSEVPDACHISDTNPPFLFQYVDNQIRIIKILGNLERTELLGDSPQNRERYEESPKSFHRPDIEPVNFAIDDTENKIESTSAETSEEKVQSEESVQSKFENPDEIVKVKVTSSIEQIADTTETLLSALDVKMTKENSEIVTNIIHIKDTSETFLNVEKTLSISSSSASLDSAKTNPNSDKDKSTDSTSMGTASVNDETDDEASYGTPDDSPKAKKVKRGKYGKNRAPLPPSPIPKSENNSEANVNPDKDKAIKSATDMGDETIEQIIPIGSHANKQEHHGDKRIRTSKSPARKTGMSTISKFMQLPGKLAFWNKSDDERSKSEASSADNSRRSSTIETSEDFQSCVDVKNAVIENIPTIRVTESSGEALTQHISLKDVSDLEESEIAKDIIDKSDALKKLIDAKLERHPEYKIVSLHEDMPSTSQCTDV